MGGFSRFDRTPIPHKQFNLSEERRCLFQEIVCEPQKEIAAGRIPLRGASWVRLNESGVDATRAAAWQAPWIWRDKLGSYQNYSQSRSSDYKRCFEEKSGRQLFVDLLGDSHLNYAGW